MSLKYSFKDLDIQALSMKKRRYEELFKVGRLDLSDKNLDNYNLIKERIKEIEFNSQKQRNAMVMHIINDLQPEDYGYYYDEKGKLKKL